MTHRFPHLHHRVHIWCLTTLLALIVVLAACGGQPSTINPENIVTVTRQDGRATLVRAVGNSQGDLPDSVSLATGDQLYTASDQTVTLQFTDGSTLQLGPNSHLVLFAIRSADRVAAFRLLDGSVVGDLRSAIYEVQAYREVAMNFSMVLTDLAAVLHSAAGSYQLGFADNMMKAVVTAGEFDMRSGNQQATLPPGWQAIAEPGKSLQIVSLVTPTPAPPSAIEAPTATPIQIISITPTALPTSTSTATRTRTATLTQTPTSTRVRPTIAATASPIPTTAIIVDTPLPTATDKPDRPPKPTNPPPPPPTNPPPPPPPTDPPPPPTVPPTDRPPPTAEPPTPGVS